MIFHNGFPRPSGATDYMDSAMFAGMMATFNYGEPIDLFSYLMLDSFQVVATRFPFDDGSGLRPDNPNNFSRDQLLCLVAGLRTAGSIQYKRQAICLLSAARRRWYRAQNTEKDAPGTTKKFPDGPDLLMPSHMNHLRICAGEKPLLIGKLWLIAEILIHSWFKPLSEPNQLMAMCKVAGPWYVRLFRRMNKKLDEAIREYWSGWRGESEFVEFLIRSFQ